MTTKSITCRACGAAVPYGRLACPACGELLASVAGAGRRVIMGTGSTGSFDGDRTVDVPDEANATYAAATPATTAADEAPDLFDIETGLPLAGAAASTSPATDFVPSVLTAVDLDAPAPASAEPEWRRPPEPEPAPIATDPGPPAADPWTAILQPASTPGAYVPPLPAGPAAPARAWTLPAAGTTAAGVAAAEARTDSDPAARSGLAVAPERLDEWARSLAVAGGAIATVGFLLPWAATVIGATGVGFFDRWGLAGPGHLLVVVGLLAIIALAMLRNPIPMWLRVGVPALVGGALVLGLVWPYLWSDVLGRTVGVFVVAIGAVLLIAAGVLALAGARHAPPVQPV